MTVIEKIYSLIQSGHKISTDTRKELKGTIFFAIKGDNFDGNEYVNIAIEKGAFMAVSDSGTVMENNNIIKVEDTVECLQQLAALHRKKFAIPVVAITGSNGKTTTKELVSACLQTRYSVFSTPGNMNNHIGLPLSILSINKSHEIAVIEIGANHIGENKLLTNITAPTHGIITNIGKDHLGEFGGFENVVNAYKEFTDYFLTNKNFPIIYPASDNNVKALINGCSGISFGEINAHQSGRVLKANPDITVEIFDTQNGNFELSTHLFGSYNLNNILVAKIIADLFDIKKSEFKKAIENYYPSNMRSQIFEWNGNTIFLDAYNANPSSMTLAIEEFNNLTFERKILVIGDMHELGEFSFSEHKNIIDLLHSMSFAQIILVGNEFSRFKNDIACLHFKNVIELKKWFDNQTFNNCAFLVKGSRSEKLEKLFWA